MKSKDLAAEIRTIFGEGVNVTAPFPKQVIVTPTCGRLDQSVLDALAGIEDRTGIQIDVAGQGIARSTKEDAFSSHQDVAVFVDHQPVAAHRPTFELGPIVRCSCGWSYNQRRARA